MKTQIHAALIGYDGKMGREFQALALEPINRFKISFGLSRAARKENQTKVVTKLKDIVAAETDVVIDFSSPELGAKVLSWCVEHKKPLVVGTTGHTPTYIKAITLAAKKIPVFSAPNFSIGVAVLAQMLKSLSGLEGFDFQIEELHHRHKKDRPSGTGIFLQRELKKATQSQLPEVLSIRGGGVFGVHRIYAMSEEETIVLEHSALNRKVFARGAIEAAKWLSDKPAGLYDMPDLLKTVAAKS